SRRLKFLGQRRSRGGVLLKSGGRGYQRKWWKQPASKKRCPARISSRPIPTRFRPCSPENCSCPGFMFPVLNLANWMRRRTNARIHSLSIGTKPSLSRSQLASIANRFPTWRKAGNIRSLEKIHRFGIFQPYLSSSTVNIRAGRRALQKVVSATMSVVGCSSLRSGAKFWRGREKQELGGKYPRNGSSSRCIPKRPMKKTHLRRCTRPTRSNVPQRVRLRSSAFARLASETFLIGL